MRRENQRANRGIVFLKLKIDEFERETLRDMSFVSFLEFSYYFIN